MAIVETINKNWKNITVNKKLRTFNASFLENRLLSRGGVYIQIGAGAGDLDARAGFRDGFTELIKAQKPFLGNQIVLVEANPRNIPFLRDCWSGWNFTNIQNIGIVPEHSDNMTLKFFYAEEDAPNFQVTSIQEEHVRRHYPNAVLKSFDIPCVTLSDFLSTYMTGDTIEVLAIDVEGIDSDLILSVDWKNVNCRAISFESIHLKEKKNTRKWLKRAGFLPCGSGLDVNGFDSLYAKPRDTKERFYFLIREIPHRLAHNKIYLIYRNWAGQLKT